MRLLINTDRRSLASSAFGLTGTTLPVVRQGDTQPLEVVLFRGVSGSVEAVDYPGEGWSLRVGVGELEAKPITGTFRLGYSGSETTELAADATASDVAAALNLLGPIIAAGGVSVEVVAGTEGEPGASFLVTFNNPGARSAIVAAAAQLYPRSSTVSVEAVTGSATEKSKQLVRFVRTPVAVATDFDPLPSATATLESVVAWDGERAVTRLAILNALAGSVVLTWHKHGGPASYSVAIPVGATATEIEEAVASMDNLSGGVTVYRTGISTFDIEVRHQPGDTLGLVNGFEVDTTAAVKVPGYSGTISLATIEVEEMLGGSASKAATLEVVLEKAGDEVTVLQIPCRVEGDLLEQTPASPLELDTPLGVAAAAATYLSKAGNLADIASPAAARANLGVDAFVGSEFRPARFFVGDHSSLNAATSGTGAATQGNTQGVELNSPTTAVGYATRRLFTSNQSPRAKSVQAGVIPWATQEVSFGGLFVVQTPIDANSVSRIYYGRTSGYPSGDTSSATSPNSIEVKSVGGGALRLICARATGAVVESISTFTPSPNVAFELKVINSGGSTRLLINGSEVAVNSNGPIVNGSATGNVLGVVAENTSTVASPLVLKAGSLFIDSK